MYNIFNVQLYYHEISLSRNFFTGSEVLASNQPSNEIFYIFKAQNYDYLDLYNFTEDRLEYPPPLYYNSIFLYQLGTGNIQDYYLRGANINHSDDYVLTYYITTLLNLGRVRKTVYYSYLIYYYFDENDRRKTIITRIDDQPNDKFYKGGVCSVTEGEDAEGEDAEENGGIAVIYFKYLSSNKVRFYFRFFKKDWDNNGNPYLIKKTPINICTVTINNPSADFKPNAHLLWSERRNRYIFIYEEPRAIVCYAMYSDGRLMPNAIRIPKRNQTSIVRAFYHCQDSYVTSEEYQVAQIFIFYTDEEKDARGTYNGLKQIFYTKLALKNLD